MMMDKQQYLYELHDAKCDMLRGLNKLTDLQNASPTDVQMMHWLAKGIKDLAVAAKIAHETEDEEDRPTEEVMRAKVK